MTNIRRISFFDSLGDRAATIAYFLQEGPRTCNASCTGSTRVQEQTTDRAGSSIPTRRRGT